MRTTAVDQSVLSRSSVDQVDSNVRKLITSGKSGLFDRLFPLFDQMFQKPSLPSVLYYISVLVIFVQFYCSTFWMPCYQENWDISTTAGKGFTMLKSVALLSVFPGKTPNAMITFLVYTVCFVLTYAVLFVEMYVFSVKRRFIPWTFYIVRLFFEFVPMLIVFPIADFCGWLLEICWENPKAEYIIYIFFSVIYLIMLTFIFKMNYDLTCHSPYIPNFPHSGWLTGSFDYFIIGTVVFLILSHFFKLIADWASLILIILHLFLLAFIIYDLWYMPFRSFIFNSIFFGLITAGVFNDVFIIIGLFLHDVRGWISFGVPFCLGIVAAIAYFFVLKRHIKKTAKILTIEKGGEALTDNEKLDRFSELGADKSIRKASFAMRVGLIVGCELFLDFSLLKICVTNFDNSSVICLAVQMLALFPGEPRLLNAMFIDATKRRNLGMNQRFMLYQVNKIRTLRTSSSSSEATEKLQELIQTRHRTNDMIHDYWTNIPSSTVPYTKLADSLNKSLVLWQEAIKDYPNSARICEEYSQFLIDCATDFALGIRMKRRCDMIDSGRSFSIDLAFRSLVRSYPHYIKKKLVTLNGNILHDKGKHDGNSSTSNGSSANITSSSADIDIEIEEQIGQSMFNFSRMRLALQRAVSNRTSKYVGILRIFAIISFIITVVCFIIMFILIQEWFSTSQESMTRQINAAHARFTASVATLCLALQWGINLTTIPAVAITQLGELAKGETEGNDFIIYNGNMLELNIYLSQEARRYFGLLLTAIANLAQKGIDVYKSSSMIISSEVPTTFCHDDIPVDPNPGPLASMFGYNGFMRTLIANIPETQWSTLSYLCYSFSNAKEQTNAFNNVYSLCYDEKLGQVADTWKDMKLLMIILSVVLFACCSIPPSIAVTLFTREMKNLPPMLRDINNDAKKAAAKSLANCTEEDDAKQGKDGASSKDTFNFGLITRIAGSIIWSLVPISLVIGCVFYCQSVNNQFGVLHGWLYHGSARAPLIAETAMAVVLTVLTKNGLNARFVDGNVQFGYITAKKDQLLEHNDALLKGDKTIIPCSGYDSILDDIHFKEYCKINNPHPTMHDTYRCASLSQDFIILQGYINDIVQKIDTYHTFENDVLINLLHLTNNHMYNKIMISSDRLAELSIILHNKCIEIMAIFFICGIIVGIIVLLFLLYVAKRMDTEFQGAKVLIRKVNPPALVANQKLIDYLLNKESERNNFEMTLSNSVIYNSDDAIICLSRNGIIEIVNPAVTKLLGYTPEQLLGQPVNSILTPEESEGITNQVELIKNGQSAPTYEDHTSCMTDNELQIPCHITILGMKKDGEADISSVVIILRDETLLLNKQKEAEEAKKQSEDLLYQILPQDIVVRLNQGEKDISFTVPSASIIFIDIVRFSEYAATLTPQQIMGNLSIVFASFDEIGQRYPLLTKIKLIGDVYMAASGLFAPNENPKIHAEQIIRFGLDALTELDEINIKLNSNLAVRIGVNSGGPVLAGVLGTDKPVFDIIGDPINIASRLQSTDIPGQIQISQATYDLVSDLDFSIEQRGEVFLKGKGKQMAYFVKSKLSSVFRTTGDFEISNLSSQEDFPVQ